MSRFNHSTVIYGEGRTRGAATHCRDCGVLGSVPINTIKGGRGPADDDRENEIVARKFRSLGWVIGTSSRNDRCPECERKRACAAAELAASATAAASAARALRIAASLKSSSQNGEAQALKPREIVMNSSKPATTLQVVESVKPMTIDDRRRINAKLHDVHTAGTEGYSEGWSDAAVAKELSVARAWVKEVREYGFGPEGSSEDNRRVLAEARAVLAEIKAAETRMFEALEPLSRRADKIEKTIIAIEAALR